MSSIGYRDWNIWINQTAFENAGTINGIFLIKIEPFLMAQQTVQFVYERIELIRKGEFQIKNGAKDYFSIYSWTPQELILQKISKLGSKEDFSSRIREILQEIEILGICLDFPLICNQIEFFIPPTEPNPGTVLSATKRSITRGVSFEVEEKGPAFQKIIKDYDFFQNASRDIKIAISHYINGLALLGLEDSYAGLIDAAFMQFYQACEILCNNKYKFPEAQKYIAELNFPDSETMQIILFHVWKVRHNYFGHGKTQNWLYASESSDDVFKIAKQVLVARWLCKSILDSISPSTINLCREIRLYNKQVSDSFNGTIQELETSFRVEYEPRTVFLINTNNKEYTIK